MYTFSDNISLQYSKQFYKIGPWPYNKNNDKASMTYSFDNYSHG